MKAECSSLRLLEAACGGNTAAVKAWIGRADSRADHGARFNALRTGEYAPVMERIVTGLFGPAILAYAHRAARGSAHHRANKAHMAYIQPWDSALGVWGAHAPRRYAERTSILTNDFETRAVTAHICNRGIAVGIDPDAPWCVLQEVGGEWLTFQHSPWKWILINESRVLTLREASRSRNLEVWRLVVAAGLARWQEDKDENGDWEPYHARVTIPGPVAPVTRKVTGDTRRYGPAPSTFAWMLGESMPL